MILHCMALLTSLYVTDRGHDSALYGIVDITLRAVPIHSLFRTGCSLLKTLFALPILV